MTYYVQLEYFSHNIMAFRYILYQYLLQIPDLLNSVPAVIGQIPWAHKWSPLIG